MNKCAGCGEEINAESCDVLIVIDARWVFCCTPHCAFDFIIKFQKEERGEIEEDLLIYAAGDLVDSLDGLSPNSPEEKWTEMSDAWERVGIILGHLRPPTIEEYLGREE